MNEQVSAEVLTRTDGVMLVLFSTRWRLEGFQRDNPDVKLGHGVGIAGLDSLLSLQRRAWG